MHLLDFFGHLHPVLVHLPIGFLILAIILQWMQSRSEFQVTQPVVRLIYLLGFFSSLITIGSGLQLGSSGEYDADTLIWHEWMGFGVAITAGVSFMYTRDLNKPASKAISVLLCCLLIITGHLGGTLTHGEGFLTKGIFSADSTSQKHTRKPIASLPDALVYPDLVSPILTDKCGGCHSAIKQKGGLRLDGPEWIRKGGKDGPVFLDGNPEKSALYTRVILDPLEEKHMPPKGKPQLTENEIRILHWWIMSHAGFTQPVKAVSVSTDVRAALLALTAPEQNSTKPDVPEAAVAEADKTAVDSLKAAGITVLPVASNSHYLLANFVSLSSVTDRQIAWLQKIKAQLVWLTLSYTELRPAAWQSIAACTQLTRLNIAHTNCRDADIAKLDALTHLRYLNLVGTQVHAAAILQRKNWPVLRELYLGETGLTRNEYTRLQQQFPKWQIDSGNYAVETLATDTQVLHAPAVK
ncbi:MAG TPA: c-type cytochrome domain-containing protein [Sediminibacterium sp.]|nr:c-type cytochrome domain-containing protein [Sediminibacterium sp.]